MIFPNYETERDLLAQGFDLVIGCDEVGMGCVAGPVVACACLLDPNNIQNSDWHRRVRDSKKVPEKEREILSREIQNHAVDFDFGIVDAGVVDSVNIFQAALQARRNAITALLSKIGLAGKAKVAVLIDGKFVISNFFVEQFDLKQFAIVKGDESVLTISAASLLAKVTRDKMMIEYDNNFPGYDFYKHKGYNTSAHQKSIQDLGLSPIHRKSFLKKYI